jgi:hypothetical protein
MAQTLEELKAENAALEAANEDETTIPPQEVEEDAEEAPEVEAAEVEEEESGEVAEPNEDETTKTEAEDWMQSDNPESQADKKYSGTDLGNAKAKLRAKLEKKHNSEVEELKAENERLKQHQSPAPVKARPTREQFNDADDPEEAFLDAHTDWKLEQNTAKQAASTTQAEVKRRQAETSANISKAVDQHYERASELADKSGISPEAYQASDLVLRQAVESVFPGGGDAITDALLASLGPGSEKVGFNLGVNAQKRAEFIQLLRDDPTGIKAGMYLGRQSEKLNAPSKRKTNAPKPAAQISGDAAATSKVNAAKKKYDAAHKRGDLSEAFKIKRAAKREGANTLTW